jgi:signal transduction histidine kinase/ActR/RegA family two-component response regulator
MAIDQITSSILRALPFCFLLVKPNSDFTILEASDDYLEATLTKREVLIGAGLFTVFPDNPKDVQSNNVASLRDSFNTVIRSKKHHAMVVTRYDVPLPSGDGFELKYWLPTNLPVLDDQGDVEYIIHRVYDLTSFILASDRGDEKTRFTVAQDNPLSDLLDYTADLQKVVELLREGERRRQAAEAKAAEMGERFYFSVDAAELGTFYCPMPLGKIYWNATCKAHFFLPPDAEIDFDLFYQCIHEDDRERTRQAVDESVENKTSYDIEYRVVAADGRIRWLRAKGRAYYGLDGHPTRFDGITIDIDKQKKAEEELRRVSQQKDDFLAMLAHELRNPLAPISAAASILAMPNIDAERVARTGGIIARQAKHMTGLINDLLDVSRVTRGMEVLEKLPVDFKLVIAAAVEQVRPVIEARRHTLSIHMSPDNGTVLGDEKRLVQIVANLLINAAKYTPEAGAIDLALDVKNNQIDLSVRDTGVGLTPELVSQVFDLFVQGQRTLERSQGGLGLGLALVRSLVELHGGTVTASSSGLNQGSTFAIQLPRYESGSGSTRDVELATDPIELKQKLKILVVDDNVDAAKMLAMWLDAVGHDVVTENESTKALTLVESVRPDLCLIDIGMPEMDGNELARRLSRQERRRQMTLVAVTGYGQEQDRKTAMDAGFDHHLVKPVDLTKLSELIATLPALRNRSSR